MVESPLPLEKKQLMGAVAVLSFGLAALFAVFPIEAFDALIAPTFVLGFFILLPLIAIFGDDLSVVASEEETADESVSTRTTDPVGLLRERYASGEISEGEFERKLDRLLETEDLERAASARGRSPGNGEPDRDRSVEIE